MISISKDIEIDNVEEKLIINDRKLILKIKSPVFDTYRFSGISFQPIITGYEDRGSYDEDSVVVVPVILQYFHNYFEAFSKIIYLQNFDKKFKVVFIHNYDEKQDGVFKSLIRGAKGAAENTGHWKEFLDYRGIEHLSLTPEEFKQFSAKYVYVFFNDEVHGQGERYFDIDGKKYVNSHFLLQPKPDMLVEDMEYMRNVYPKHDAIEGKKIYISRKKTTDRKWKDEDLLEKLMIENGYENVFMEDVPFLDQVKMIQEASNIVCLYGSALVNCSLCGSGTRILSINTTGGYRVPVYQEIFDKFNIDHHLIDMSPVDDNTISHIEREFKEWEQRGRF